MIIRVKIIMIKMSMTTTMMMMMMMTIIMEMITMKKLTEPNEICIPNKDYFSKC